MIQKHQQRRIRFPSTNNQVKVLTSLAGTPLKPHKKIAHLHAVDRGPVTVLKQGVCTRPLAEHHSKCNRVLLQQTRNAKLPRKCQSRHYIVATTFPFCNSKVLPKYGNRGTRKRCYHALLPWSSQQPERVRHVLSELENLI
jgi:hypothetical protein